MRADALRSRPEFLTLLSAAAPPTRNQIPPSSLRPPPPAPALPGEDDAAYFGPKPGIVRYDAHRTTSIQNRFEPLDGLETEAVFSVDDDVRIPCASLAAGFGAWRRHKEQLVVGRRCKLTLA